MLAICSWIFSRYRSRFFPIPSRRNSEVITDRGISAVMFVQGASAQSTSNDWNSSWTFASPLEKSQILNQAMAMELMESEGLSSTYNVYTDSTYYDSSTSNVANETYCDVAGACNTFDTTSIGTIVEIGDDVSNVAVDATSSSPVSSNTNANDSSGSVIQRGDTSSTYNN